VVLKATGAQTSGAFALGEASVAPGTGTSLHVHDRTDEVFYVVAGELLFRLGERVAVAAPGAFVSAPRGTPHGFWNRGPGPARVLFVLSPPGVEGLFAEAAAVLASDAPPGAGVLAAIEARHDVRTLAHDWLSAVH
jgi:quercetin dioxygenase-like cupin family protein